MRTITLEQIRPVVEDKAAVIDAVKRGFMAHSRKEIVMPSPVQMMFSTETGDIKGDCHIKTAYSSSHPFYCVKIATGFYQNPAIGLPVNNGLVMLFSSATGQPLALLQDDGHLTSVRTAAAGALSASLHQSDAPIKLGIVGTGHQAELQARWVSFYNSVSKITIWGRSDAKAKTLAKKLCDLNINVETSKTCTDLCNRSDVIVTTTPSTEPIINANDIRPDHHIVALGSDSPGKIELDPQILAKADRIILDDYEQCLEHGEFGHAIRSGLIERGKNSSLGSCFQSNSVHQRKGALGTSVVDLTGLGAQDLAVASMVWQSLAKS
jgi:ornithine cyclodeaminase